FVAGRRDDKSGRLPDVNGPVRRLSQNRGRYQERDYWTTAFAGAARAVNRGDLIARQRVIVNAQFVNRPEEGVEKAVSPGSDGCEIRKYKSRIVGRRVERDATHIKTHGAPRFGHRHVVKVRVRDAHRRHDRAETHLAEKQPSVVGDSESVTAIIE